MTPTLSPGFSEPVADTQRCFRAVLDAMARPGRISRVGGVAPPASLCVAAGAVALTLVDAETSLWLDPAAAACGPWIAFHTGAMLRPIGQADFVLALSLPDFDALRGGTHDAPETSATVILQVASLSSGHTWRLTGPGLREPTLLSVDGLPADFGARWRRNRALFPCGVDLVLCAGDALTALPRTVQIEET